MYIYERGDRRGNGGGGGGGVDVEGTKCMYNVKLLSAMKLMITSCKRERLISLTLLYN